MVSNEIKEINTNSRINNVLTFQTKQSVSGQKRKK